jgi:hypothetical protein
MHNDLFNVAFVLVLLFSVSVYAYLLYYVSKLLKKMKA